MSPSVFSGRALAIKPIQNVSAALKVIEIVGFCIIGEHTVDDSFLLSFRQNPGEPFVVEN